MQKTRYELEKHVVETVLPLRFIRKAEKLYKKIREDTDYGSMRIDLAQGEVIKTEYIVTEMYTN
jgi:hypothetical protein